MKKEFIKINSSIISFRNTLDTNDRPAVINVALNVANTTTLTKDQRQHALRCVLKFAKLDDAETWDLAFSKTLNTLTQILDNTNDEVVFKVYCLRILRELLMHHTNLFMNYIELTIFRILKAQSETESEVSIFFFLESKKFNVNLELFFFSFCHD